MSQKIKKKKIVRKTNQLKPQQRQKPQRHCLNVKWLEVETLKFKSVPRQPHLQFVKNKNQNLQTANETKKVPIETKSDNYSLKTKKLFFC